MRKHLNESLKQSDGLGKPWQQERTDGDLLSGVLSRKALNAVRPFGYVTALEVLANAVMLLLLGRFVWMHMGEPRFVWPAVFLLLFWGTLVAAGTGQWLAFNRLDFSEAAEITEDRLATLMTARLRMIKWLAIFAPIIWMALCVVAFRGLAQIDLTRRFSPFWFIAINMLVWIGWTAGLLLVARQYRSYLPKSSLLSRIAEELAVPGARRASHYAERADWVAQVGLTSEADRTLDQGEGAAATARLESLLRRDSDSLRQWLFVFIASIVCTGIFIANHTHRLPLLIVGVWLDLVLVVGLLAVVSHRAGVINAMRATGSSTLASTLLALRTRQFRWIGWGWIGAPLFLFPALTVMLAAWFSVDLATAAPAFVVAMSALAVLWMIGAAALLSRAIKSISRWHGLLDKAILLAQEIERQRAPLAGS